MYHLMCNLLFLILVFVFASLVATVIIIAGSYIHDAVVLLVKKIWKG